MWEYDMNREVQNGTVKVRPSFRKFAYQLRPGMVIRRTECPPLYVADSREDYDNGDVLVVVRIRQPNGEWADKRTEMRVNILAQYTVD